MNVGSDDDPEAATKALLDRLAAILNEAHELVRQLDLPRQPNPSPRVEAERVLYFTLISARVAGLIQTMEGVVKVLRRARRPVGLTGEEWLAQQERAFRGDGS